MLDSPLDKSFENGPKLAQRLTEIANQLKLDDCKLLLTRIDLFIQQHSPFAAQETFSEVPSLLRGWISKFGCISQLSTIAAQSLRAIEMLHERNVDLLQRCDKYEKDIHQLTAINQDLHEALNSHNEKANADIEHLLNEIEIVHRQKQEMQRLYEEVYSEKSDHLNRLLEKEIALREECQTQIFEQRINAQSLAVKNQTLRKEIEKLGIELRESKESQWMMNIEGKSSVVDIETVKTLPISEYMEDDGVEQRYSKAVSLASDLQDFGNQQASQFNYYQTVKKRISGSPLLRYKSSACILSTTESFESAETPTRPTLKLKQIKEVKNAGLSKSNVEHRRVSVASGIFSTMKSHIQLGSSYLGLSGLFKEESRIRKIHNFLRANIVEKRLQRFKKKQPYIAH